jgi:hypothetical protein
MDNLKEYTTIFLDNITSQETVQNFPFEARFVARMIATLAENYSWDVLPLIGSFVILRYVNFKMISNLLDFSIHPLCSQRHAMFFLPMLKFQPFIAAI